MPTALDLRQLFRSALSFVGLEVRPDADTEGPTISSGSAAPSAAEPDGSLYLRTANGAYARASSAWQALLALAYASVASSTPITGAQEAETNFDTTHTIPANRLRAGTVVRIRGQGIHTATTGAETHSILLKMGSTSLVTVAAVDPANADVFYFDFLVTIRTAGASGTMVGAGTFAAGVSGTASAKIVSLGSTAIDTTAAQVVAVAIDRQATATDSDSARLELFVVEVVG